MKNTLKRIIALALVLVTCMSLIPTGASAASYSRSTMDQLMNKWNATTYSKSNQCTSKYQYEGAWQCAAFSRYVFMNLYGHKDTTNNSNNTVTTKTYTTSAALLEDLKNLAAPGDAIRFTNTKATSHTHIFNLYDILSDGKITVYESNKDGKTNKAYRNTYGSIAKLVNNATGVRTSGGKFSSPVKMQIIHSKKNTNPAGSFSGCMVTVTLNAQGGTVSNATITRTRNTTYGTVPTPKRTGYIFKGWYTAQNGGTKIATSTKLTSNSAHTLYARWEKCPHKTHSGGICQACGEEYKCKIVTMNPTAYKVTKSCYAPTWSRPYSNNSKEMDRVNRGNIVIAIAKTVNEAGNTWYLLSDGNWIYSGNVRKTFMPRNVRYVTAEKGLALHYTASNSGKTLEIIPEGGFVTINTSKRKGDWIYVTNPTSNLSGWVNAKYLTTKVPTGK